MRSSRSDTKPEQRFVLYVPQLESLLREASRVPGLIDTLLRRGRSQALAPESPQSQAVSGLALPAAALSRMVDCPGEADGIWLRADPIGLVTDLAAVWLDADATFAPGAWLEELTGFFAEEGLTFELCASGRGYLRLEHEPESRFVPPWALAGKSLERCLPEGADARDWRRRLNESQVILQQFRRSAEASEAVPGSLWFWGGGTLPDRSGVEARVDRILAEDPVLIGLARWLGIPHQTGASDDLVRAGNLLEWPARFSETAEENLARLQGVLRSAWHRLRLGRIRELELVGVKRLHRFGVRDAWRVWR